MGGAPGIGLASEGRFLRAPASSHGTTTGQDLTGCGQECWVHWQMKPRGAGPLLPKDLERPWWEMEAGKGMDQGSWGLSKQKAPEPMTQGCAVLWC